MNITDFYEKVMEKMKILINPAAPQQAEASHPSLLQNTVLLPPRSLPPPTLECERRSPSPVRLPAHRSMYPGRPRDCDLLSCLSQENRNRSQHSRLCRGRPDGSWIRWAGIYSSCLLFSTFFCSTEGGKPVLPEKTASL